MKYRECEAFLQQRLDGGGGEALKQHLARCPHCRDWHRAARRLAEGLRAVPRPKPLFGLTARIVAGVKAERCARHRWRRYALVAAAAACLLLTPLAVPLLRYFEGRGGTPPPSAVADSRPV
jgi:predicted anti-sigma-YlaC factor YlaD